MTNVSVSSGDFLGSYRRISETALREPVSITGHGRERLVLLSADEYRRPERNDRAALYPWELADDALHALESAGPLLAAAAFDHEITPK